MVEREAQKKYPTVEDVLAKRGNPQFDVRPGVLAEMAEICELAGGCEDGIEWGMNNPIEDVPEHCPNSGWCVFMLKHFDGHMTARLRTLFLRCAIRESPALAGYYFMRHKGLSEDEYRLVEQKADELPAVRAMKSLGKFNRADRRPQRNSRLA